MMDEICSNSRTAVKLVCNKVVALVMPRCHLNGRWEYKQMGLSNKMENAIVRYSPPLHNLVGWQYLNIFFSIMALFTHHKMVVNIIVALSQTFKDDRSSSMDYWLETMSFHPFIIFGIKRSVGLSIRCVYQVTSYLKFCIFYWIWEEEEDWMRVVVSVLENVFGLFIVDWQENISWGPYKPPSQLSM